MGCCHQWNEDTGQVLFDSSWKAIARARLWKRSIAPVVIHANKEVMKTQMETHGTGVSTKRPSEDGITGASLSDDGNKKQKAASDHGHLVSPSPDDSSFMFSASNIGPSYSYNKKNWNPEVRTWTTVESVKGISCTIVWNCIILSNGCVEQSNVSQCIDVDVVDDGMTLQVKTRHPGQSVDPSRNHAIEMKKKQEDITAAAGRGEDLQAYFAEYDMMVICEKAEMAAVEQERVRCKDNHKWNFLRISLEKQCDSEIHYNIVHLGDAKSERDSVLIGLKEVKEDVYHEKKAMELKMKTASPQSTCNNTTEDRCHVLGKVFGINKGKRI